MNKIVICVLLFLVGLVQAETLEKMYWDCEYAASVTGLSSSDAMQCSVIYEKLLREKFGGSYAKFLQWWKINKEKEFNLRKK